MRSVVAAQRIAEFLRGHAAVEDVRYPGLAGDPGHALAARQMEGFGTVVAFDIAGGLEAGSRFAEALSCLRSLRAWARRNRWWWRPRCSNRWT